MFRFAMCVRLGWCRGGRCDGCRGRSRPPGAVEAAAAALNVIGLNDSFGCVDLLPSPGGWLVLEVGTDGPDAHVDRELSKASTPEPYHVQLRAKLLRNHFPGGGCPRRWLVVATAPAVALPRLLIAL